MNQIVLGKDILGGIISLKYEPYATRPILVQGISGSRKSSFLEEILKRFNELPIKANQVIVDIEGEFGRLRKYADYIIVGEEGEIPISVETAEQLGRQVRIQNINVILQISSLATEREREEFLANFIKGVLEVSSQYWKPMLFVLDEVQLICTSTKETASRDAIVRLVQTGRKRGILSILGTQGIKDLYKHARVQCSNRIIGYTYEKTDRIMACELLMIEKNKADEILTLDDPKGRFYTWGTDITKVATIFQLESVAYTHQEKYAVPKISKQCMERAQELLASLQIVPQTVDDMLRNEVARLNGENMKLRLNQMTDDNKRVYRSEGFAAGKIEGIKESSTEIERLRTQANKRWWKKI